MLNYVTLVLDGYYPGGGSPAPPLDAGFALFAPSAQLTDPSDHQFVPPAPVQGVFRKAGAGSVQLLATDNGNVSPQGWMWTVVFEGVPGNPAGFSFFLAYATGATQYLSALAPVPYSVPVTITNLDGGSAVTGAFPVGTIDGGKATG